MSTTVYQQRLTIFEADDITPMIGSYVQDWDSGGLYFPGSRVEFQDAIWRALRSPVYKNIILHSEDFTTGWLPTLGGSVTTANYATTTTGVTLDLLTDGSSGAPGILRQLFTPAVSGTYEVSAYMRQGTSAYTTISMGVDPLATGRLLGKIVFSAGEASISIVGAQGTAVGVDATDYRDGGGNKVRRVKFRTANLTAGITYVLCVFPAYDGASDFGATGNVGVGGVQVALVDANYVATTTAAAALQPQENADWTQTTEAVGLLEDPMTSTDPAHERPFLLRVMEFGESTIDFIEGRSVIGLANISILDKRTDANDQSTGWFTAILADAGGNNHIIGRRVLLEQQDSNGEWFVVMNGIVGDIELDDNLVTYKLTLRDVRERERNHRIFNTSGLNVSLIPSGMVNGYGKMHNKGTPIKWFRDPTNGIKAKFTLYSGPGATGNFGWVKFVDNPDGRNFTVPSFKPGENSAAEVHNRKMAAICSYVSSYPIATPNFYETARANNIRVRWRAWGSTGDWTLLPAMPAPRDGLFAYRASAYGPGVPGSPQGGSSSTRIDFLLTVDDGDTSLPSNGEDIEFQVIAFQAPSEEYPLYVEDTFGQILKDVYDGTYSDGFTLPILYDEDAMNAFVESTPIARMKITGVENDARDWVEKNIYKPLGYAPLLNAAGRVRPIPYTLPDPDVELTQLDDSNITRGSWTHSSKNVINRISFKYHRDTLVKRDETLNDPFDDTNVVESDIEETSIHADSASLLGDHPVEYEPVTIRQLVDGTLGFYSDGTNIDDLGVRLSRQRAKDAFDRYAYGAQVMNLEVLRSDPLVRALVAGDWVIVASSWMPDYSTGERGINRIGQIASISDISPIVRVIEVVDGGPYVQPLDQPEIDSAEFDTDDKTIDVTIASIPTDAECRIDFAISSTLPVQSSGAWTYGGRTAETGTFKLHVPEDCIVWIRARSEGVGRRPSSWTNAISVNVPAFPFPYNVSVELVDGSDPIVRWKPNQSMGGARIYYYVYAEDDDVPEAIPTDFVDVDADDLSTVLTDVRVQQFDRIQVVVEAWEGFGSGAVSGSVGGAVQVYAQRISDAFIIPTVNEAVSQNSSQGTLVLTPEYDPQYRISKYEFRTKEGNSGIFTSWTEDTTAPFGAVVNLVSNETSYIEYRVSALDLNGDEQIVAGATVSYNKTLVGYVECRARMTSATASSITVTVDGISPNAGTTSVQLVAVTGSAALTAGSAIGVGSASGSTWTFSRGAPLGQSGQAQFRASQSPFQSDDDFIEIPEQGRDTVFLSVQASVLSTSATAIVVRITVTDPVPSATITLVSAAVGCVVSPDDSGGVTISSGGTRDYTITRPAFKAGSGRVKWTASATGRVSDLDAVDVPAQEQDSATVVTLTVKENGDVIAKVTGASTTNSYKYLSSKSSMPSDGSVTSGGTGVNTTAGAAITITLDNLDFGERCYFKIVPYTATSGGGNAGTPVEAEVDRQNKVVTKILTITAAQWQPGDQNVAAAGFIRNSYILAVSGGRTTNNFFVLSPQLPQGVTVTNVKLRAFHADIDGDGSVSMTFGRVNDGGITGVVTCTKSGVGGGYSDVNQGCSELTTNNKYWCQIVLSAPDALDIAGVESITFTYDAPNLATTI